LLRSVVHRQGRNTYDVSYTGLLLEYFLGQNKAK
jgi:hypothetical protein